MLARLDIDENICKGCGLCTIACPRTLLKLSDEISASGYTPAMITSQEKCAGCALCAGMCPALAINVYSRKLNEFTVKLMPAYQILYQKINFTC